MTRKCDQALWASEIERRIAVIFLFGALFGVGAARGAGGNGDAVQDPLVVKLPGHPFGVVASADGESIFVALTMAPQGATGVAVVQKEDAGYGLKRVVPLIEPTGLALTHDGKMLIAAAGDSVFLLDTKSMISGSGNPVTSTFSDGTNVGSIYVNVTPDDKTLFVSEEQDASITVINLGEVRSSGYDARAVIGKIPVGQAPIALTFSPDGQFLYTTSEVAQRSWGWPAAVKPEGAGPDAGILIPEGAVVVVNVSKALTDPAHSVVSRVPAGGSPVRMTISPDGERVYVTARGSNAVMVFDAAKLVSDPEHARLASVPVGPAPVPLAIIQGGKRLVVGNSNRFGADANTPQTLSVLETSKISHGNPVVGAIGAGSFPREMCVSADGGTLFVANFLSNSLEVIDARNLPMTPGQSGLAKPLPNQALSKAEQLEDKAKAAEATMTPESFNNVKQLATACLAYASDNNDVFPATLDALLPEYITDRTMMISPFKPSEPIGYSYTPLHKGANPATTVVLVSWNRSSPTKSL